MATFTNVTKSAAATFTSPNKSGIGIAGGQPIGLLLALTYDGYFPNILTETSKSTAATFTYANKT